MHPVPDEHMDNCATGRVLTCGKITIKFPDWHYYGGLLTVCDTVCHPVTPLKCPGSCDLDIQGVIKMAAEGFYWREAVYSPYFDFSEEKFMFKRTWQVVFWGARNYFRHPKTTCRSPEGSGRASLHSRCAWKRKIRNKKLKNDRSNIQSASQKWPQLKRKWTLFVFSTYRSPYFSSSDTMSRDLFSVTAPLVHDVRCIFAGLLWWILFYFLVFQW